MCAYNNIDIYSGNCWDLGETRTCAESFYRNWDGVENRVKLFLLPAHSVVLCIPY